MTEQKESFSQAFEHLLATGRRDEVRAGHVLADQGEGVGRCFYIINGTMAVEVDGRRVAYVKPGEVAGELSMLTGQPRRATLRAATDMVVQSFPSWEFLALLEEHPDLAAAVARNASERTGKLAAVRDWTRARGARAA